VHPADRERTAPQPLSVIEVPADLEVVEPPGAEAPRSTSIAGGTRAGRTGIVSQGCITKQVDRFLRRHDVAVTDWPDL
jgi:hypothetical protein